LLLCSILECPIETKWNIVRIVDLYQKEPLAGIVRVLLCAQLSNESGAATLYGQRNHIGIRWIRAPWRKDRDCHLVSTRRGEGMGELVGIDDLRCLLSNFSYGNAPLGYLPRVCAGVSRSCCCIWRSFEINGYRLPRGETRYWFWRIG
jgi:hypothetical protein